MTDFATARQVAFDKAAKAILEGDPTDLMEGATVLDRDILEQVEHIRVNYPTEERAGKLKVIAAIDGLGTAVLPE